MEKTGECGINSRTEKRCVTDKEFLAWAAQLFAELGETLAEASETGQTFSKVCRAHGFSWSVVRRLLTLKTIRECKFVSSVTLAEVTEETPEPCSELYKAIFGRYTEGEVDLPPDYEESVNAVLEKLTEREGKIVRMRYGIGGENPMTLEESAEAFHVTRERVRQIEIKAIAKLGRYPYREILRRGIHQYEIDQELKRLEREGKMMQAEGEMQEAILEYERMKRETEDVLKSQRDILREGLNIPIEYINLSVRSYNCLHSVGITTVGELLATPDEELRKIRNLGYKSMREIHARCEEVLQKAMEGDEE